MYSKNGTVIWSPSAGQCLRKSLFALAQDYGAAVSREKTRLIWQCSCITMPIDIVHSEILMALIEIESTLTDRYQTTVPRA
jgi:hypothetical protein